MSPFQPEGEKARWKYIYDLLSVIPEEQVATYEELAEEIGIEKSDPNLRVKVQMAVRRATTELERNNHRTVESVRGQGYRVVKPEGHMDLAKLHHKKAGRSLVRGQAKVASVDLNRIEDPEVRKGFETMALAFGQQIEFNKRMEKKSKKQDWAIEQLRSETEHVKLTTETDIEELRLRQESTDALLKNIATKLGVVLLPDGSEE